MILCYINKTESNSFLFFFGIHVHDDIRLLTTTVYKHLCNKLYITVTTFNSIGLDNWIFPQKQCVQCELVRVFCTYELSPVKCKMGLCSVWVKMSQEWSTLLAEILLFVPQSRDWLSGKRPQPYNTHSILWNQIQNLFLSSVWSSRCFRWDHLSRRQAEVLCWILGTNLSKVNSYRPSSMYSVYRINFFTSVQHPRLPVWKTGHHLPFPDVCHWHCQLPAGALLRQRL